MRLALRLAVAVCFFSTAAAQTLWGDWFIVSDVDAGAQGACRYRGEAHFDQDGSQFQGTVFQTLISGSPFCPPIMNATLMGTFDGDNVQGTLEGGQLGTAAFQGTVDGEKRFLGSFMPSPDGPFADVTGNWIATEDETQDIPTLSPWGVAGLGALLSLAALGLLRRRA